MTFKHQELQDLNEEDRFLMPFSMRKGTLHVLMNGSAIVTFDNDKYKRVSVSLRSVVVKLVKKKKGGKDAADREG